MLTFQRGLEVSTQGEERRELKCPILTCVSYKLGSWDQNTVHDFFRAISAIFNSMHEGQIAIALHFLPTIISDYTKKFLVLDCSEFIQKAHRIKTFKHFSPSAHVSPAVEGVVFQGSKQDVKHQANVISTQHIRWVTVKAHSYGHTDAEVEMFIIVILGCLLDSQCAVVGPQ